MNKNKKIKLLHIIYRSYIVTESFPNHLIEGTFQNVNNTMVYSMLKPGKNISQFKYSIFTLSLFSLFSLYICWFLIKYFKFSLSYLFSKKIQNAFWIKTNFINLMRFIQLLKIIEKKEITHIHVHFGYIGNIFAELKKFANIKFLVSFYGVDTSVHLLTKYANLIRYCDCFLVLSNYMKGDLIRVGYPPEKIEIVRIALKLENMPSIGSTQKKKQIVFSGRLTAKKAVCDAIEAFNLFYNNNPEYTFIVIGEGPEHKKAEEKINDLSLQNRVKLLGFQNHEHLLQHMVESEIFILPSKTAPNGDKEGTPVVIIEAELLGLPVISTKHAGIPEIVVNRKNALLSNEGDIKGMALSLDMLAKKPELLESFSRFGVVYAENNFNLKKRVAEVIELYHKF